MNIVGKNIIDEELSECYSYLLKYIIMSLYNGP